MSHFTTFEFNEPYPETEEDLDRAHYTEPKPMPRFYLKPLRIRDIQTGKPTPEQLELF